MIRVNLNPAIVHIPSTSSYLFILALFLLCLKTNDWYLKAHLHLKRINNTMDFEQQPTHFYNAI